MIKKNINNVTVRNPGLDIFRSISLFFVVLQHSFIFTDTFFPKFRALWIINNSGVDMFFVISGFLIGGIIYKKYKINSSVNFKDILTFYKRRWYKIVPMYFFTILICLLLSFYNIYYAKDFSWKFLVFLQNLTQADFYFLPHTYSLTIEEWFYIFWPLGLYFILKLKKKSTINSFYYLIFIWIVVAITLRLIKHFNGVDNWDSEIRKSILTRIDATIYGVMIYFIHLKKTTIIKKYRLSLFFIGSVLYLFSNFILKNNYSLFFNNVLYYSFIPFSICLILPFFYYLRLPEFIEKKLTIQSLASYSIYLIHLPLFYILYDYFKPYSGLESLFLEITFIIIAYLFGFLLYKFIEKPIMDLRDK